MTVVKMPKLGLTMTEGIITKWLKNLGDYVAKGEALVEIETDKSVVAYESPESGYLKNILAKEGANIPILSEIAVLSPDKEQSTEVQAIVRVKASPLARKIAAENSVDIALVPLPAGKVRIEKADVLNYINTRATLPAKTAQSGGTPVSKMRKIIASRMKDSLSISAHVSFTSEIDMTNALMLKKIACENHLLKLTINDIIVKSVACALANMPEINRRFDETCYYQNDEINIGIAVALDDGLVVPVVRNADKISLREIVAETKSIIEKAREGKLLPDDYSGGSITVSNLGMYDISSFNSIINQPQIAILSVAKIIDRATVINGEILIRPIMNITLTVDHRMLDGIIAAKFIKAIKAYLEEPASMLF